MLALCITYLTGTVRACQYNNYKKIEMPPHPARFFSALTATYKRFFDDDAGARTALEKFATFPPPTISHEEYHERDLVPQFEPDPTADLDKGEYGKKCANYHPTADLKDPRVYFVWENSDLGNDIGGFTKICKRVDKLGQSPVMCHIVDPKNETIPFPTIIPDEDRGTTMIRWVHPDQLDRLEAYHQDHRGEHAEGDPLPFVEAWYKPALNNETPKTCFTNGEWIIFETLDRTTPITSVAELAKSFRGALLAGMDIPHLPPELGGHNPDGTPVKNNIPHLAYVPLPFAHDHGRHGNGAVKGIAIILPPGLSQTNKGILISGLKKLGQEPTVWGQGLPPTKLRYVPPNEHSKLRTFAKNAWDHPSRTWVSVTPVVLGYNPRRIRSDLSGYLIADACEEIGLPRPRRVRPDYSSPANGTARITEYQVFRKTGEAKVHALIQFEKAVSGPIIIGSGRYYGLGLFKPWEE